MKTKTACHNLCVEMARGSGYRGGGAGRSDDVEVSDNDGSRCRVTGRGGHPGQMTKWPCWWCKAREVDGGWFCTPTGELPC